MVPHDDLLTEKEFRYRAECRRLARLARRPPTHNPGRIDIIGYLRAVEKLEPLRRLLSNPDHAMPSSWRGPFTTKSAPR